MKVVRCIALILVIIGALNWGLWGFFQYDLVADLFGGPSSGLSRLIYSIVGLAGLYCISLLFCSSCGCKCCKEGSCKNNSQEK